LIAKKKKTKMKKKIMRAKKPQTKTDTPMLVYSREGNEYGLPTGAKRACRMEGCRFMCLQVYWPDGRKTWPCMSDLYEWKDGQRIGHPSTWAEAAREARSRSPTRNKRRAKNDP